MSFYSILTGLAVQKLFNIPAQQLFSATGGCRGLSGLTDQLSAHGELKLKPNHTQSALSFQVLSPH